MTIKEQMYCGVHRNPSTSENRKDRSFRTMAVYTKKARLMNHLSRGWDITQKQAQQFVAQQSEGHYTKASI